MVQKYTGFQRNERTITAGSTNQFSVLQFVADDDCTVVGVSAEVVIASEPTDAATAANFSAAGYARLVVNRAGNTRPTTAVTSVASWGQQEADTLNDADAGDTWAISGLAIAGGGVISANSSAQTSQNDRTTLAPRTKRKLRRGDSVEIETQYSNGGNGNAVFQEVVIGTIFIEG